MGHRRLYKIKWLHMLGTPESERLKVTVLNLFDPTAPPPFQEVGFFILRHSLQGRGNIFGYFLTNHLGFIVPQGGKAAFTGLYEVLFASFVLLIRAFSFEGGFRK